MAASNFPAENLTGFSISKEGGLEYNGRSVLHDVPSNVKLSKFTQICKESPTLQLSASSVSDGAFLGFHAEEPSSRHVFSIGKLRDTRFTSVFRFKVWWTTHWIGNRGSDLETETQLLILDKPNPSAFDHPSSHGFLSPYILLLPIYEGNFRASLQAGHDDNVDVCVESGSTQVLESSFNSCVYLHACHDPILLVRDAVAALKPHLRSFKMLEEKALPSFIGYFGWCTWDAFYLTVNPQGIWCGVKALTDGGVPPKFIIIDDGWQSITFDNQETSEDATSQTLAGDQMWCRLNKVCENSKFSNYKKGSLPSKKEHIVACEGIIDGTITLRQKQNLPQELETDADISSKQKPASPEITLKQNPVSTGNGLKIKNGLHIESPASTTSSPNIRIESSASSGVDGSSPSMKKNVQRLKNGEVNIHLEHGGSLEIKHEGNLDIKNEGSLEIKLSSDTEGQSNENGKQHKDDVLNDDREVLVERQDRENIGLKAFITDLKMQYPSVEDVFVWHALIGYWGGVRPDGIDNFGAEIVQPVLAHGLSETMEDLAVEKLVNNSMGLVPPENANRFYDSLHSYLASNGVTGIKVDVIHVLEMLGEKYGGRVELCKKYYEALSHSIKENFGGNRAIASMQQCNDFMFLGTEQITVGRVGDDFWPVDGNGNPLLWLQGFHLVHCAYNSLWMGQFFRPDWDMFQTTHPSAAFHAASRAISGGPIYVSDFPGKHDLNLLKKMVFPDGTLSLCVDHALPTIDCLFNDPLHDGKTILKIWNFNKCGGVIGAFNCQGGGWSRERRSTVPSLRHFVACSTKISPLDICWNHWSSLANVEGQDRFVMYSSQQDKLFMLDKGQHIDLTLEPISYDIFTMGPIHCVGNNSKFSPIGLLNMMNVGGSLENVETREGYVQVKLRGQGDFCAYSSSEPKGCWLDGNSIKFTYNPKDGRTQVQVPWKTGYSILKFDFSP